MNHLFTTRWHSFVKMFSTNSQGLPSDLINWPLRPSYFLFKKAMSVNIPSSSLNLSRKWKVLWFYSFKQTVFSSFMDADWRHKTQVKEDWVLITHSHSSSESISIFMTVSWATVHMANKTRTRGCLHKITLQEKNSEGQDFKFFINSIHLIVLSSAGRDDLSSC